MVGRVVLLDSGPLGLVTNPRLSPQGVACAEWLQSLMAERARVVVPEIADYEVRRELLRANKTEGVARLDALGQVQKKLVRWSISGGIPNTGATLVSGEKTVGRLTSVAADGQGGATAIGFARRSHFDPGATATGVIESTGAEFTGTVV